MVSSATSWRQCDRTGIGSCARGTVAFANHVGFRRGRADAACAKSLAAIERSLDSRRTESHNFVRLSDLWFLENIQPTIYAERSARPASLSSSRRMGSRPTTTRVASGTSTTRSHRCTGQSRAGCLCLGICTGVYWTISNGRGATRRNSVWWRWIARRSCARQSQAPRIWEISRGATQSSKTRHDNCCADLNHAA